MFSVPNEVLVLWNKTRDCVMKRPSQYTEELKSWQFEYIIYNNGLLAQQETQHIFFFLPSISTGTVILVFAYIISIRVSSTNLFLLTNPQPKNNPHFNINLTNWKFLQFALNVFCCFFLLCPFSFKTLLFTGLLFHTVLSGKALQVIYLTNPSILRCSASTRI